MQPLDRNPTSRLQRSPIALLYTGDLVFRSVVGSQTSIFWWSLVSSEYSFGPLSWSDIDKGSNDSRLGRQKPTRRTLVTDFIPKNTSPNDPLTRAVSSYFSSLRFIPTPETSSDRGLSRVSFETRQDLFTPVRKWRDSQPVTDDSRYTPFRSFVDPSFNPSIYPSPSRY